MNTSIKTNLKYGYVNKITFYLQYIMYKFLFNPFEIKSLKRILFQLHVVYFFSKLFPNIDWTTYARINFLESKFGKFHIRPGTFDAICASPDFERPDMNFTINLIRNVLKTGKHITYLDIGADFGLYSVILGNLFRSESISFFGFEPFEESYKLFLKNIEENNLLDKIKAFHFGLFNTAGTRVLQLYKNNPGSNSLHTIFNDKNSTVEITINKLDTCATFLQDIQKDVLFIKLDIEGSEQQALEGSKDVISMFPEVYIMVEDFIDDSIVDYLISHNFEQITKKTPYNSFWYKKNEKR